MANYNEEAVSKAIKADPSIGGAEAKAIHSLLKGRGRGPAAKTFQCPDYPGEELIGPCECDKCAGACNDGNGGECGQCFACEAIADDDHWWEVNRADVLQI